MFFRILSLILIATFVFAAQDVELLADNVGREGEIVTADKNVLVYSQDYFISADKASYDQQNGVLELFGNVNVMRGENDVSRCSYAKINLNNNDGDYETTFMMNKNMEVWLQSDTSSGTGEYYITSNSVVSSCNVQNPDWKIKFSSGKLNRESKFLHLYNPVFYIGNIPVFYLPYFGFSTDTRRRTGLLPPELGYGKSDGFYYKQPIYIAEYNSWDLQFDPQIRTRRGAGIYGTFRFADSPYSRGSVTLGAFRDTEGYRRRQIDKNSLRLPLKNKTHKGADVKYERDRLVKHLIEGDLQEGLRLNFTTLNDIDYLNLKSRDENNDEDSLVRSKLNYFISGKDHYFGVYARYYVDTSKIGSPNENKDTLQEYPSFQYHKFVNSFVLPNLLYSFDVSTHNYTRKIGVEATRYDFTLPASLHIPLADEYFGFSYYNDTYLSLVKYKNKMYRPTGSGDKNAKYVENSSKFSLHTDLAKAYENFFHSINLSIDYAFKGYRGGELPDDSTDTENGFIYDMQGNAYANFIGSQATKDELAARVTQYFYDKNGRKILRHSISQGYYTEDGEYSNLKNIIGWYPISNLSLYNKIEYSHKNSYIEKIQSSAAYTHSLFDTNILHTMWKSNDVNKQDYVQGNLGINLRHDYKLFAGIQYNLEDKRTKEWKAGISHKRKCWNYSVVYSQEIEPTTTTAGSASKKTHGVYLAVNFYPMGGVGYDFSVTQNPSGESK